MLKRFAGRSEKTLRALCAAAGVLAAAMQAFALPDSLAHRWSFNTDDKDEITGADPASRFGTRSISDGKVHFLGNSWGGGSLNLGAGLLGSGDATVEIWATQDDVRNNSIIFSYSNANYGKWPSYEVSVLWTGGMDINKDAMWLKSNGADKLNFNDQAAPYTLGTEYHIAMTFHDNGDGSTSVYWQKRNAATGVLEASGSGTAADWTLAGLTAAGANLAIGVHKHSSVPDACASYNEVRVWNGVLGEDQLTANAFMGPDVVAPSTVVGAAGFALAPGATFRVAVDFTTTGAVTLGEGSKLRFTEAATFTAGSFVLPAGTAIADYVDADAENFDVSTSGNTITVTRKSTVPATASWIGSGSVSDPANWDCRRVDGSSISGALPMDLTVVTISGAALNIQAPANSNFKAASIAIGACTLAADCDWRGFPVAPSIVSGSVNLNGYNIYLPSLADVSGAKFTGAGELHLDAPSGSTAALANFDVTGRSVAKEGAGDLVVSGAMPVGNGGAGTFTNSLGKTIVNGLMSIGHGSSGAGTVSVPGGTLTAGSTIVVGYDGGIGTLDVCGGTVLATVNVNSGSTLTAGNGGTVQGSVTANSGGTLVVEGGMVQGSVTANDGSTVVVDGGTVQGGVTANSGSTIRATDGAVFQQTTVALNGGGTFVAENGSVVISYWLSIGHSSNNSGTASVANGSLSVGDTLYVGYQGSGSFDVGAGGTVTARPRLVANAGTMTVHDGGRIVTPQLCDNAAKRATSIVFDGGTLQATGASGDFIKGFNDFAIGTGGLTVDTAEEGYALGVVNTKFKITPSATPAITLANGGSLDLSGATLDLTAKPSGMYVLGKVATGAGGTFTGIPASITLNGAELDGWQLRMSKDGKRIIVAQERLLIIIR